MEKPRLRNERCCESYSRWKGPARFTGLQVNLERAVLGDDVALHEAQLLHPNKPRAGDVHPVAAEGSFCIWPAAPAQQTTRQSTDWRVVNLVQLGGLAPPLPIGIP